jgi:hypothetical protein
MMLDAPIAAEEGVDDFGDSVVDNDPSEPDDEPFNGNEIKLKSLQSLLCQSKESTDDIGVRDQNALPADLPRTKTRPAVPGAT